MNKSAPPRRLANDARSELVLDPLDQLLFPSYRKYGFDVSVAGEIGEGAPIKWTFFLEDGSFDIENYILGVPLHEEASRSAGFRQIHWCGTLLSPEGEAAYGRDFWATFLDQPHVSFLECFN